MNEYFLKSTITFDILGLYCLELWKITVRVFILRNSQEEG